MTVRCQSRGVRALGVAVCLLAGWRTEAFAQPSPARSAVTFQTEDKWSIRGTLTLPTEAATRRVPAVLLLTEPVNRLRTTYDSTVADSLPKAGFAVLSIDMRGTAGSFGKKDYLDFTMSEREALLLDVKAAVNYLTAHKAVDARRIGILAPGLNVDNALLTAAENSAVKALVLITGTGLSDKSRAFVAQRPDIPVLCLVGKDQDKEQQRIEAEPYFLSRNPYSDMVFGVQRGTNMMNRPGGLSARVTDFFVDNLRGLGIETPVTFTSTDGWTLKGTLTMPDGITIAPRVPGVVFVHGYNHSSEGWTPLARAVVRGGMAALTFDWRGTRKSLDDVKGEVGVNLTNEEREKIPLDVKAAVQYLASQPGVDATRLALIGATATNNHALRAAMGDGRIKTYVGLSFYAPAPDVKTFLQGSDLPLLIISSLEDVNADGGSLATTSKEVYRISKSKESELLMYDDAGRGTGMVEKKPELKGMIVRWLQDKLSVGTTAPVSSVAR